jgi:hypothetical protein
MTAFSKENFHISDEFVHYFTGEKMEFIGRFKYGMKSSRSPFTNFLVKNFTVEEYFGRLAAGESPLKIAESKGFVPSHIKKILKNAGFPATAAGFKQYKLNMHGLT